MPQSSRTQPPSTLREEQQRKWDERKLAESPESLDAQESPLYPKKHKEKPKVVKSKEYKIWWPKKEPSSGNVPYVQESSVLKENSMITLQYITTTSFYVVIESVARLVGLQNP